MCKICTDTKFFFSPKQLVQLNKSLDITNLVTQAINELYNDRAITKATQKALLQSHYEPLKQAVNEGYNVKVEYNSPNYEFLKQLQTNTAVFAAFKSHASVKQMVGLLKTEDGNLRSKEDFKKEALKIDATYRTNYLNVEYDTAVRTARMAAQWQKYQKNKRLYPNLKYILTKSSKPDAQHLRFVGIVAPIDGSFWNTYYPPNRFNCQCGVEPTDEDTTDIPSDLPALDPAFAFNAGKMGEVFDLKNSSYIKSVSPKEQPALIKQAEKLAIAELMATTPYQPLYKSKSGTYTEAHPMAFDNEDFQQNLKVATEMANSKLNINTIQILPLLEKYNPLRSVLLPDARGYHNPDFRIDGKTIDAKEPVGTNNKMSTRTIQNNISRANNQAHGIALIVPTSSIAENQLMEDIYSKFHHEDYADFKLYLKYGDDWVDYNQQEFIAEYKKQKKPQ